MLVPSRPGADLIVCTTCRAPERQDGGRLLRALETALEGHAAQGSLALHGVACLWACSSGCSAHLRAPGRTGYLFGRLTPTSDTARALLDYAAAYLESEDGSVAYADWPEGVKGRFIARLPPQGFVWDTGPPSP